MTRQRPLVIHLPIMSDKSVFEMHCCLVDLVETFESNYGLQLWRYYDEHPVFQRPARFDGEPF